LERVFVPRLHYGSFVQQASVGGSALSSLEVLKLQFYPTRQFDAFEERQKPGDNCYEYQHQRDSVNSESRQYEM